jgi:hypothetical protein
MPKQQPKKQKPRSNDSEMAGIVRTNFIDPRHIAYSTQSPHDVRHLMPRTREQMGFDPFPVHNG